MTSSPNRGVAIIIHGICDEHEYFDMDFPSPSNAHWLPWLQQKFLRSGVLCQILEMPKPYAPVYEDWATTFEQLKIDRETIIVGHSAGCGFILKWLHHHPEVKLERLILVAPWLDPKRMHGKFLECQLDPQLQNSIGNLHVLYSKNEGVEGVSETKDLIIKTYTAAQLYIFEDKGHFCFGDLGRPEFEEVWDLCKKDAAKTPPK